MQRAGIAMVFLVAAAFAPGAAAQQVPASCPDRPADGTAAKNAAKQWFLAGESMFAVGKYAQALESFQCSLQMYTHRVTIYNASQAALFAGDKRTALTLTEQYLAIAPGGEKADEARTTIEKLTAELADEPAPEEEAVAAEEPRQEPEPAPQEHLAEEDDGIGLGPVPLIVAAVLTAGLGATTVALDFEVGERFDKADGTGESADRDSAESLQVAERVFFGLTLAGAVTTGVLLFLTDFKKRESEEEAATVAMTPLVLEQGAGLALLRRF